MRTQEQLEKELENKEKEYRKIERNMVSRAVDTLEWNRITNILKGEINALKWALNKK
jgi:hypothetical protein